MSSKRRLKRRECTRKKQYETGDRAHSVAAGMRRRLNEEVSAYKCPHGNHWHIGHRPIRPPETNYKRFV